MLYATAINDGINGGVRELLDLIAKNPGQKVPFFMEKINASQRTIERRITKLRNENRIEFRGAPKTGGYWVVKDRK